VGYRHGDIERPADPVRCAEASPEGLGKSRDPTRRSNSEAMARSREFKEAMRQRIRDLAASRDLPDDEIKSVLRLKHQEIGAFAMSRPPSVTTTWRRSVVRLPERRRRSVRKRNRQRIAGHARRLRR
jgi:hypothetical protein